MLMLYDNNPLAVILFKFQSHSRYQRNKLLKIFVYVLHQTKISLYALTLKLILAEDIMVPKYAVSHKLKGLWGDGVL
jgi:hypothetical protein